MRRLVLAVWSLAIVGGACTGDQEATEQIDADAEAAVRTWADGPLDDADRLEALGRDLGALSVQAQSRSSSLDACRLVSVLPTEATIVADLGAVVCESESDLTAGFEGFVLAAALLANDSDEAAERLAASIARPVSVDTVYEFIRTGDDDLYREVSLLAEEVTGRPDS